MQPRTGTRAAQGPARHDVGSGVVCLDPQVHEERLPGVVLELTHPSRHERATGGPLQRTRPAVRIRELRELRQQSIDWQTPTRSRR